MVAPTKTGKEEATNDRLEVADVTATVVILDPGPGVVDEREVDLGLAQDRILDLGDILNLNATRGLAHHVKFPLDR